MADFKFSSNVWEWDGAHWRIWFTQNGRDIGWEVDAAKLTPGSGVVFHPVQVDTAGVPVPVTSDPPQTPPREAEPPPPAPPAPERRHDPTAPAGER